MDDPSTEEPWSHGEAAVNGVRLHYVAAGDPGDPLVVLLHGFPEFWYSWRHQIPALAAAGYRVVAPDMRGYNTSEKPAGVDAYGLDELVADVAGLVEHCGDGPAAAVVGHDWGGTVAWAVATTRPDVTERVAVLNAPHPRTFLRELRRPRQLARMWYAFAVQVPAVPEFLLRRAPDPIGRILTEASATEGAFTEADLDRYREAFERPGALTAALNYYRAYGRETLARTLWSLVPTRGSSVALPPDLPVLVLWGGRDPALGPAVAEGLAALGPGVRVEWFPAVGHCIQNEAPEAVTDRLLSFLGAQAAE